MDQKATVYQHCIELLNERVEHAQKAMVDSQKDSNGETKSSAGDKYETGRAMAQLDKERHARRHSVALDTLYQLQSVGLSEPSETVTLGSLVVTDLGTYYIAIGIGTVELNKEVIHVISIDSPMGQELLGLEEDDELIFRNRQVNILKIR